MTLLVFAVLFFLAACYQAGRAEYWKRRAADPWDTAWKAFEKRNLKSRGPRVVP